MSALLDALGFVGDTLGRPGAAVRGALAGRPDQLYNLLPGSETMGLLDPERKVSGRGLLREYGLAGQDDNWGNFAGGMAAEIATDPLTWGAGAAARPLARLLGAAVRPAPAAGSNFGRLRSLRERFPMLYGMTDDAAQQGNMRLVGGRSQANAMDRAWEVGLDVYDDNLRYGTTGMYDPARQAAALMRDTPQDLSRSIRHESTHGMIDQAARSGAASDLPWIARPAARLYQAAERAPTQGRSDVLAALGIVADETAAHALQHRGLLNQAQGGARFLFSMTPNDARRHAIYADKLSEISPGVARAFRAAGWAPAAAAGAAGLAGAAYGGQALGEHLSNP